MIFRTPYIGRARGFCVLGFQTRMKMLKYKTRPQVAEGEWGVYGWCEMLRCKTP
jgi:hypothetical protein